MKKIITSREISFFILGVMAMLIFVIIWDWESFMEGFNSTRYR
jgi:hypothetical protein